MKNLRSKLASVILGAVAFAGVAGMTATPAQAARVVVRVSDQPHHRYHWHGRYYDHRRYRNHHWEYY